MFGHTSRLFADQPTALSQRRCWNQFGLDSSIGQPVEAISSCDSFVAATAKLFHAVLKKLDVGAEKSGKHVERIARTAAGQRLSDSNIKLILS